MAKDFLNDFLKAVEEGKTSFEASREQAKERRIKEEDNEDPIMFVFPEQREIPEHVRKQLDNFAGTIKDIIGGVVKSTTEKTTSESDDQEDLDKSPSNSTESTDVEKGALTPFVVCDAGDRFITVINRMNADEENISIRYVEDELVVTSEPVGKIHFHGPIIAGNWKGLAKPINVRVAMPEADKATTSYYVKQGLLFVSVQKKPNDSVFVVK